MKKRYFSKVLKPFRFYLANALYFFLQRPDDLGHSFYSIHVLYRHSKSNIENEVTTKKSKYIRSCSYMAVGSIPLVPPIRPLPLPTTLPLHQGVRGSAGRGDGLGHRRLLVCRGQAGQQLVGVGSHPPLAQPMHQDRIQITKRWYVEKQSKTNE